VASRRPRCSSPRSIKRKGSAKAVRLCMVASIKCRRRADRATAERQAVTLGQARAALSAAGSAAPGRRAARCRRRRARRDGHPPRRSPRTADVVRSTRADPTAPTEGPAGRCTGSLRTEISGYRIFSRRCRGCPRCPPVFRRRAARRPQDGGRLPPARAGRPGQARAALRAAGSAARPGRRAARPGWRAARCRRRRGTATPRGYVTSYEARRPGQGR